MNTRRIATVPQVFTSIESFDPKKAHGALLSDFVNRKPSEAVVIRYAHAMSHGQWSLGQPLIFDERGHLIDGKQRLLAVIRSGATIEFVVVRGIPRSTAGHIDIGKTRSAADILRMRGGKNVIVRAAISRIILAMERGARDPESARKIATITIDDVVDRADTDPLIDELATELTSRAKFLQQMLKSCGAAGWFYYCLRAGLDERAPMLRDFMEILSGNRTAMGADDPAHVLRTRLTRPEMRTSITPAIVRVGLAVKGWNAFALSKPVNSLFYRSVGSAAEAFPRLILDRAVLAAGRAYKED